MTMLSNSRLHTKTPLQRHTPLRSKGIPSSHRTAIRKLRVRSTSETSVTKENIQFLLWQIVCARDKDCILAHEPEAPPCNGYKKDGTMIYQADHLVTRANSATYADSRLVVKVCKGHHGWKNWNKARYDELVKRHLSKEIVELWERSEADRYRTTSRKYANDWKLAEVALKQELEVFKN